jgi:hypothetical protein
MHGRVTTPAEKADVRPEIDILRTVPGRIRLDFMTDQAYRNAIDIADIPLAVQHDVGIYVRKLLFAMAVKAICPAVFKRSSPQQFRRPFVSGAAMNFVTGQASELAPVERIGSFHGSSGYEIYRVVVFGITVTGEADIGRVVLGGEERLPCLGLRYAMATDAGNVGIFVAGIRILQKIEALQAA